ncbi:unnamed protein product [Allacma fusca]|uniref:Uncharacterized protein n=1 Tax=Allacma fusca TaxID=39272 RepID=A0A8J2K6I5_9HEXA|nr:unnamed protein product [Allacma fusca]
MPRKSKKAKILEELNSKHTHYIMLRGTGSPEEDNFVEEMIWEIEEAIVEAGRCRYGSICKVPKSSAF